MELVIASHNAGKIAEIRAIMADLPIKLYVQADFGILDTPETATTFVENALLKAHAICQATGLATLADDSGLEINALQGAPGIYSARYAGLPANFQNNMARVLTKMNGIADRRANFRSVMVLLRHAHDPSPFIAEGLWQGEIVSHAAGDSGFGYDPIFYVPALHCTAAELPFSEKNRLSHRAMALKQIKQHLQQSMGI